MGVYNPHVPYVVGQEWVPIREENYAYSPDATTRENGYSFTLPANRQLNQVRFYTNNNPQKTYTHHMAGANIYPRGKEAETGPIGTVIIPVNNGAITGGPGAGGPFMTLDNGATLAECVATAADFKAISAKTNTSAGNAESGRFNLYFAVNDFIPTLQGKRILNVSILYSAQVNDQTSYDGGTSGSFAPYTGKNQTFTPTLVQYNNLITTGSISYGRDISSLVVPPGPQGIFGSLNEIGGTIKQIQQKIAAINLGDLDQAGSPSPSTNIPAPWTLTGLKRFDLRNGTGSYVQFLYQIPVSSYDFFPNITFLTNYIAMQVTYCEETRVAAGATRLLYNGSGLQIIPMTDLNLTTNPILPAGDYTVTFEFLNPGDNTFILDDLAPPYPQVNALREKYSLPTMPGVQVNVPFPLADHIGEPFTKETTRVIPQISLHASGSAAPFVEPHVYGRQAVAQVYGSVTAFQNVLGTPVGANQPFPWVRYYARRWGDTTVPLKIQGFDDGGLLLPGTVGDATTPDNAALDITGDIDIRIEMQLDNWIPAGNISPVTKWGAAGTRSYLLQIDSAGKLGIVWSADGTNVNAAISSIPIPAVPGQRLAVRATLDVDNGAAGKTAKFYTAFAINTTYTQFGTDVISGGTTSIFSGSAPVEVGGHTGGTADLFQGTVQAARILNGIGGTEVANPDFKSQATGTTSFTDAAGRVWTITGSALIQGPTSGSSASITPAAFDQLPEILDGWREVTLRFGTSPLIGISGASPVWQWTATGELPGNRWEVLGAMAPAVSGVPLNEYTNPAPLAQQLSSATYGQPSLGSAINLSWVPGFSPPVTGTTPDPWSDAALLFSQDMPAVTGFTLAQSNQPLTGVSLNCNAFPWYVPSSMAYNQVTWSPTSSSVPVTGFGYYELQRMDTVSTDWFTIAQVTSPTASGFKDYEARVGIVSSYRIRSVNSLLFPGPWSNTISGSFAAPGVTGIGMGANARTLLFTSNSRQNGSRNLAYAMAYSSDTTDTFNFPEAGFTQFQFMYGRDYQTAFRPLERGGSTFQRTVLVQAAAIPTPTLPDFVSIRDLAWDSLPYVCVRDEDGNRWFANVLVPQGRVQANNRTIYLIDLTITEVTNTPAIVVV